MMDIVERLRAKPPKGFVTSPLMIEAADEIERLREALNKIVEVEGWPNRKGRDSPMARIAVEALGEHVKRFCF